ncbi:hypothetical protein ARMSODRAFT_546241, partial [Armillaria solidipes]
MDISWVGRTSWGTGGLRTRIRGCRRSKERFVYRRWRRSNCLSVFAIYSVNFGASVVVILTVFILFNAIESICYFVLALSSRNMERNTRMREGSYLSTT